MNKINPFFSEISHQIPQMYDKVIIITQIWHRTQCYFTTISNAWYLIPVPNINKITTFFAVISQQRLKRLWRNGHNYWNLAQGQILFYMHQQHIVPDTVPNMTKIIAAMYRPWQHMVQWSFSVAVGGGWGSILILTRPVKLI